MALLAGAYFNLRYLSIGAVGNHAMDYRVFADAVGRPLAEVYQPRRMPFSNPPPALMLLAPLRLLGAGDGGFAVWLALSTVVLIGGVARLAGWRAALLSLVSFPAVHALVLGQVVVVLTGLLALALTLPSLGAGALIAVVGSVKPQLVLLAPLVAVARRDWRMLVGMAVATALLVLLSLALFGAQPWIDWVRGMPAFYAAQGPANALPAIIAPAARGAALGIPVMVGWTASGLVAAVAVMRLASRVDGAWLMALLVAASLAASPYALLHDALGLEPASVLALSGGPWVAGLLALPIYALPSVAPVIALVIALLLAAAGFAPPSGAARKSAMARPADEA